MTLSPTVQVSQAAASGAFTKTYPIVDHGNGETRRVGFDEDPDLRGLSMLCNVGQRFPQHGLDIRDDRFVGNDVQRSHELDLWRDGQHRGELVDNRKGGTPERSQRFFLEFENRGADLSNRLVELVNGARKALVNSLVVHGGGDTLQAEASGEQPLNHVVVQITCNAIPILKDSESLLVGSSVAELQGDGGLTRKSLRHVEVCVGKGRVRDGSARHDRTSRNGFTHERKSHRLTHRDVRTQVQIDLRLLIHRLHANAVTLLHGLPRDAVAPPVAKSDEFALSGTGSDHHLQLVRIIIGRPHEGDDVG